MKSGKKSSPKIDEAVSKAANYEVTIVDIARRSERRAWFVAFSAILMSLVLAGGYFLMLPLKEKVPYLVMADAYTGTSTVARLREDSATASITTSEAVNRSNVSHYVLARESYDWSLLGNRDWNTVFAMSSEGAAGSYKRMFDRTNPDNLTATYGRNKAIRVKILSLQLFGGGVNTAPKSAVVRFQRFVYDKTNGNSVLLDNKIATIEFTYKAYLEMDEEYRVENPLGFWVTNYRVDNDAALPSIDAAPRNINAPTSAGPQAPAPVGADGVSQFPPGFEAGAAAAPAPAMASPDAADPARGATAAAAIPAQPQPQPQPSNANGAVQR
jgi:type IV secretion system protein VirB8